MRHLTIRLQLTWLTLVAVAAFALIYAVRPGEGILDAQLAHDVNGFRQGLGTTVSIDTLYLFRAQLAADMVFLLAYGLLLRQSVLYLGRHPWARLARQAAVLTMVADATENVCSLTVLRALIEGGDEPPSWVFLTMNVASIVKWASAGAVMLFLAARWRTRVPALKGGLKMVGAVIVLAFALGGLGSLLVSVSPLVPRVRGVAAIVALLAPGVALLLQFRLLDMIGLALRFVWLARVPWIILFVAAAFGPIALGPAVGLLGGILDVPSWWGVGVVAAGSIVLAFACATQINLVRAYGWQRTLDRTLRVLRHRALGRAVSWTALVSVGSLVFSVGVASLRVSVGAFIFGLIGGVIAGAAFVFIVEWIAAYFSQNPTARTMPQLAAPFRRIPLLGGWLRDARESPPPAAIVALKTSAHRWSIAGRLFGLSSGYIEVLPGGGRRLLPGHTFATIQLIVTVFFYALLIFGKKPGQAESVERLLWVPTAGSIVLLLQLVSWALAGVTFFLDRYRTPLFTAIVALALVTGTRTQLDHVVPTNAGASASSYALATPAHVLAAFHRPVLIASAGGGIQAGAWTARVLQGLDERLGGALRSRVALVSSVSGGSMGALYYGAYYDGHLSNATKRSMEPSLDEIATALIGADLLRVLKFWGRPPGIDRGQALERSWAHRLPSSSGVTLRQWADDVRRFAAGETTRAFPAFLMNTTIAESGRPMAFATTQFPTKDYRGSFLPRVKQYPVAESANEVFKLSTDPASARDVGVEMATAARLSATFPYVSPATTLDIDERRSFHLIDGGYYDNYGLVSLAQWLDDALETLKPAENITIDVIIIRGLVESESQQTEKLREGETMQALEAADPDVPRHGWAWQIIAPPSAFLKTRTFGQWAGGNQMLKLLIEKWKDRHAIIRPDLFDFPVARLPAACKIAPLSWKLSKAQQECIEQAWKVVDERHDWNSLLGHTPTSH